MLIRKTCLSRLQLGFFVKIEKGFPFSAVITGPRRQLNKSNRSKEYDDTLRMVPLTSILMH